MIATRAELAETNPELLPPSAPPPGSSQEEANAIVTAAEQKYQNILRDPNLTNVQKAALNPAYNAETATVHGDRQIGVGSAPYTGGAVSYTHLTLPTICSV